MEFDKNKVYTALNADKVKIGSKGFFSDSLACLMKYVTGEDIGSFSSIVRIADADIEHRFYREGSGWNLFYLVEEPKEKKLRPYKDTDEMIKDFVARYNQYNGFNGNKNPMYNPLIWIKLKGLNHSKYLIARFSNDGTVTIIYESSCYSLNLRDLLKDYTYLDGTPCGIEEAD